MRPTWICWPLVFASLGKILKSILLPACTCTVVAHSLAWFWLWWSAFFHTPVALFWILWYLTISIGFLFPVDCVAPNPSSLCAKELKGLGFPHWPPRVPPPPYSWLSLQMLELSIYPTEHFTAAHPSTGYLVKQLYLGNRIMMDPPCASACMSTAGVLSEVTISPFQSSLWT